jgi:hypothetical protein
MATPPPTTPARDGDEARTAAVARLVRDLEHNFRDSVERSLNFKLDGSVASLAVVDHYLAQARSETRAPILALLAASAGAYFGELVARHLGGLWLGDGREARHLRLLLTPNFAYFSPVDMAFTAILGAEPGPDDPRLPPGLPLDPAIHLRADASPPPNPRRGADLDEPPPDPPEPVEAGAEPLPPPHDDGSDDATWIGARLAELAPVPADEFYSLTTRYETLELILELLATRRAHAGYEPYTYTVQDYLHAFS